MDSIIVNSLKEAFADSFALFLKAANFHWNVEGIMFPQLHEFFGNFYEEVYGCIDMFAEVIRTTGEYAPATLNRLSSLTTVSETHINSEMFPMSMLSELERGNNIVLAKLMTAYKECESAGEIGISNFLQDRIQAHEKHAWMLKSILKSVSEIAGASSDD